MQTNKILVSHYRDQIAPVTEKAEEFLYTMCDWKKKQHTHVKNHWNELYQNLTCEIPIRQFISTEIPNPKNRYGNFL